MDEKAFDKLGGELAKKTNDLLEAAAADQKKEMGDLAETLRKELGSGSEAWKNLQKQLDEIQTEQKKQIDYEAKADRPLDVQLKEAFDDSEFKKVKEFNKKGGKQPYTLIVKADDITNSNSITGTIPAPMIVPGISSSPYRQPFLRDIVTVMQTNSPTIYWYEETARTDGSAMTAEAAVYGQGDQTWEQKSQNVEKITEYQKFSDEMTDDNAWLQSVIRNKLLKDLSLKLDVQQLSGDATGNNLTGIHEYDTAYSAPTGLAANVPNPTYMDILLAAYTQVTNAYFTPSYFIMHPTNVAQIMTSKTSDSAYQLPPWVNIVNGQLFVMGIPVIKNTGVTVNTFTVGDFSKVNLAVKKDIEIRLWDQNSTDPIYGMNTITAVMRAGQFVSGQDTAALVTGSLSQANLDALKLV
jgi:HK97 family phage major capsid protein